jgi:hypothetical protein
MRSRFLKAAGLVGFLSVLLTAWATPAMAHFIRTATVKPSCTRYTITVKGPELKSPDTVDCTITFTPTSGYPITVTGSIPVSPDDAAGDFGASQTNSIGPWWLTSLVQIYRAQSP